MPVPGDIPVMLEIALAVCREQSTEHRLATIVVPDRMTDAIRQIVDEERRTWAGSLEIVPLPRPERWVLPILKNPWLNHGVQLIAGTAATSTTHLILHDADLFMFRRDFLDARYEECQQRDLDCFGVQPVAWDAWFAEHGRTLAATWELCCSVKWLRAWAPAMQMSHKAVLWGESHTFDSTLHPQALTDPSRIAISGDISDDLVHFGHVTAGYRLWRAQEGRTDGGFVLILIRMFIETFASNREDYDFPSAKELAEGLSHPDAPLRFPALDEGRAIYSEFRSDVSRILEGPWIREGRRSRAEAVLAPFDRFYEYSSPLEEVPSVP
jgi:hypothetical protein